MKSDLLIMTLDMHHWWYRNGTATTAPCGQHSHMYSLLASDLATLDEHLESASRPDPSFGHILLTMGKGLCGQIQSSHVARSGLCALLMVNALLHKSYRWVS